jgi:hypothetical protein
LHKCFLGCDVVAAKRALQTVCIASYCNCTASLRALRSASCLANRVTEAIVLRLSNYLQSVIAAHSNQPSLHMVAPAVSAAHGSTSRHIATPAVIAAHGSTSRHCSTWQHMQSLQHMVIPAVIAHVVTPAVTAAHSNTSSHCNTWQHQPLLQHMVIPAVTAAHGNTSRHCSTWQH